MHNRYRLTLTATTTLDAFLQTLAQVNCGGGFPVPDILSPPPSEDGPGQSSQIVLGMPLSLPPPPLPKYTISLSKHPQQNLNLYPKEVQKRTEGIALSHGFCRAVMSEYLVRADHVPPIFTVSPAAIPIVRANAVGMGLIMLLKPRGGGWSYAAIIRRRCRRRIGIPI